MELRDYQVAALEAVRGEFRAGRRRVCLVAPTGSGKTVIASEMVVGARGLEKRVLFLAHRKELLDQVSERLAAIGVEHGFVAAGRPREERPVMVASIPTLVRRGKVEADFVVVDECAHARAPETWAKVLGWYSETPVVGLTATPWRLDGKGLGELFDALVVAATPRELTEQGWLCPVTGFAYDRPDLEDVAVRGGDYAEGELEVAVDRKPILEGVVRRWKESAGGKRTVCFAVGIRHSRHLVEEFLAAGVKAEHLDGTTPKKEREAIQWRLRHDVTQVVSNVAVLTEGVDIPELEVAVLARPTQSLALYLQMVGRVRRVAEGKLTARIHDHAGCVLEHGLPDADRDYSLTADTRKARKETSGPSLRQCEKCLAVFDAKNETCPACGHRNETQRRLRLPMEDTGRVLTLEQIAARRAAMERSAARMTDGQRSEWYARLCAEGQMRGYKPGWAAWKFKVRFGHWPRRGARCATSGR